MKVQVWHAVVSSVAFMLELDRRMGNSRHGSIVGFVMNLINRGSAPKGDKMVDADLASGAVGSVGAYDVSFIGGKLVAKIDASPASGVQAEVSLSVDAAVVLDALAKAIPGTIDDAIIAVAKAALVK